MPILFRVAEDGRVRWWTGPALGLQLVRHLGVGAAVRVVHALGEIQSPPVDVVEPSPVGTSRRRFIQLATGGFLAAGILVTGAVPASADPVASLIKRHREQLPRTYSGIRELPADYRLAVYAELTPGERSAAWVAHLESARASISPTPEQDSLFEDVLTMAADPDNFVDGQPPAAGADTLSRQSIILFGVDTARAIFATGP